MNVKNKVYLQEIVIAFLLFSGTFALYTFRLTEITPGMWGDEVGLGWMAQELLHRPLTPFLSYNYGHPTLLVYFSAFFIALLGRSIFSLRIVSVLFGAASVGMFYIFCRLYFRRSIAVSSAILLGSQYVLIVVSRFAYEMSAGIFFLVASGIGITMLARYRTKFSAIFAGTSLSLGLYTYLALRPLVPILLGISGILILKRKIDRMVLLFLLLFSFMLFLSPLIFYAIYHPKEVNARFDALSVFNQHLPTSEIIKELQGASFRTFTMFGFTQDQNLRQNPGTVPPFDLLTSILFLSGMVYLWIKNRAVAAIVTILTLCILATDIVTLERIPEFHYYGLGHPNTLRVSLLVPIVIFTLSWILNLITHRFPKDISIIMLVVIVGSITLLNIIPYYTQPDNPWIYTTNFVVPLKVVAILNTQNPTTVTLSSGLYDNQHIRYFLKPTIQKKKLTSFDCTIASLPKGMSIFLRQNLKSCSSQQLQMLSNNPSLVHTILFSPWNTVDAIIFTWK